MLDEDWFSFVPRYLYIIGILLLVYTVGSLGFSVSWILFGAVFYFWRENTREDARRRNVVHTGSRGNERETLLATVSDLPSWVTYPDVERVEWLNKIIHRLWPFANGYIKEWCMTSLQANIQVTHPALASFKFVSVELGDVPPRVGGVKVYSDNTQRDELYIDLDMRFCTSSLLRCKIKGVPLGVRDLQICGILRLVFKPLTSQLPLFGCMNIFFLENPKVEFNLLYAANLLDIPGLHGLVRSIIIENIAWIMVSPSRIAIPMVDGVNTKVVKYPPPEGVVRLVVLEAKDLVRADSTLMGGGLSDPYVVIKVGDVQYRTKVIQNCLNPRWNETFEIFIDTKEGISAQLEVFDYDPNSKDDSIGSANLDVIDVDEAGNMSSWMPLEGVKTGSLHIQATWLYLSQDPLSLSKINSDVNMSTCVLIVNLDSAHDMPQILGKEVIVGKYVNLNKKKKTKQMAAPVVHCTLCVGKTKLESWERANEYNSNPVWEQNFRFLVQNPQTQNLELKFTDLHLGVLLGELTLPIKCLLKEPELTMYQPMKLTKSGEGSTVMLRASLRILTSNYTENTETWILPTETTPIPDRPLENKVELTEEEENVLISSSVSLREKRSKMATPEMARVGVPDGESPTFSAKDMLSKKTDLSGDILVSADEHRVMFKENNIPEKGDLLKPTGAEKLRNKDPEKTMADVETKAEDADQQMTSHEKAEEHPGPVSSGAIQLTLGYDTVKDKFFVTVHQCRNSYPTNGGHPTLQLIWELSDASGVSVSAYVKVYLLSTKDDAILVERKTSVKREDANPVFDETLEFAGQTFLKSKSVKINVKQRKSGKIIGHALLESESIDIYAKPTLWINLQDQ